jgi:RNA polymerase sigma factor (sigma-70 family)
MNQLLSHNRCGIDRAERALLARISTGDRSAMDQLYMLYFERLAKFFLNVTLHPNVVEDLINETMLEVWKAGESIRTKPSVLPAIMRLAYSRVQKYFAEVRSNEPHSQCDVRDWEQSKSKLAKATASEFQVFLSNLPVEERAVLYFVYASGFSRREIADVMQIACDYVDMLLCAVRATSTLYLNVTATRAK